MHARRAANAKLAIQLRAYVERVSISQIYSGLLDEPNFNIEVLKFQRPVGFRRIKNS